MLSPFLFQDETDEAVKGYFSSIQKKNNGLKLLILGKFAYNSVSILERTTLNTAKI